MSVPQARSGSCLCGAVTYRSQGPFGSLLQCHCENCRRLSGNFVAATRAATKDVHIDDPADVFRWHDLEYAMYGFCSRCGSTLFYRAADRPHVTAIMVGGLNDASGLSIESVWFTEQAQAHNTLPEGVPHHTGNG
ncbi:MAG: GFA family protein [Acidimicrobiia bacterium]|nr:GFA family protein [Acidimicrobiia bacterium]